MPSKTKRSGLRRKPLVVSNEDTSSSKKIDAYFLHTPTDDKTDIKLGFTAKSDASDDARVSKNGKDELTEDAKIVSIGCLSTPEVSPEKAEMTIKSEIVITASSLSEMVADSGQQLTSSSSTSNSSDCSASSPDVKPRRRGRPNSGKSEASKSKQNHLLTDFFPVRKSSRKTAKKIQRERDELMRNLVLDECEDGLKVVHYEGKGRGIAASKPFSKGDFVVEYAGDLVELKEAKFREQHYKKDVSFGCYMYFFSHAGKSYCIDATKESERKGRLLNHSRTKANCVTKTLDIGDKPYLILVASRDIEPGEELVYDYGDRSKEAMENNPWLKD
ncbi:histone-lysine N-methyltransferase set-1-like isoform X1 [Watersipora subatra]|uniref:histone-lysine N-methyltransferase set-1-like isoform X1 n=1 Tax=Watersipora subatra TaxID=2589382 RepID=UPI00355BC7DD